MNERIVVTGMGAVNPLGLDVPSLWEALIAGKSGVDYISLFDAGSFETRIAAEVKGFNATDYVERKQARHMDRYTHFAVVASLQAVEQAKLDFSDPEDIGVIIGTGIGGLATLSEQFTVLAERGPGRISPPGSRQTQRRGLLRNQACLENFRERYGRSGSARAGLPRRRHAERVS